MIRLCAMFVGFFHALVLAVPPTPVADPSGIAKNRYISMSVPSNDGEPTALRVTLVLLHHVSPPYPNEPTAPPFTSFEGEYRWVGPPVFSTESDADPTPFVAAPLQCAPYYHDWSTLGLFHVYGDAVVTSSSYDVATLDQSCAGAEEGCADLSSALTINTSRFGDVTVTPHTEPSAEDFSAVVSKASRAFGSLSKASMQLQPEIPDPTRTVNVVDILTVGNGFGGWAYPFAGPSSCGSPQSTVAKRPITGIATAQGDPTLKVFITPVPAQGTSSYPQGTQIAGQELIAPSGGFRAFFNVQLQDYNPGTVEPFIRGWQIQIDAESMRGLSASPPVPGVDLVLPQEPCPSGSAGNTHCRTLFGEVGARCVTNQCTAAFASTDTSFGGFPGRSDWILTGSPSFVFSTVASPTGPLIGGGSGRPFEALPWDDGQRKYVGTLVLDIPAEAAGHEYTLSVRLGDETLVVAGQTVIVDMPFAQVTPAVIRIGTLSDATGMNRCRFISFVPGHSGEQMAIRVKLVSLHHPCLPFTSCNVNYLPFTSFEGQYRWVGAPTQHVESTASGVPFYAATLQCDPHYQDWSPSGYLHVTGSAVVPSSIYEVQFVPASCMGNEDQCAEISSPITLETTAWGDVEVPFNPPAASVQPDLADVSALINKFRSAPGAPIKARALLAGSDVHGNIEIDGDLSFIHISACIDAFRGSAYSSVHVGPEACP